MSVHMPLDMSTYMHSVGGMWRAQDRAEGAGRAPSGSFAGAGGCGRGAHVSFAPPLAAFEPHIRLVIAHSTPSNAPLLQVPAFCIRDAGRTQVLV